MNTRAETKPIKVLPLVWKQKSGFFASLRAILNLSSLKLLIDLLLIFSSVLCVRMFLFLQYDMKAVGE